MGFSYIRTEEHKKQFLESATKARAVVFANKKLKQIEYYKQPKLCLQCSGVISFYNRLQCKFCSKSCGSKYNNAKRTYSPETKEKLRKNAIKHQEKRFVANKKWRDAAGSRVVIRQGKEYYTKACPVQYLNCCICESLFTTRVDRPRKTCSRKCATTASLNRSYHNGSRKTFKYYNKWQNKKIVLESSWEKKVAILLDEFNIEWIRPKPIDWIDDKNKTRLYYPDFYLPQQNMYLDPKNPYCMVLDKRKMEIVSQQVNIKFGPLKLITEYINTISLPVDKNKL